jgi:hypothetical protein
LSAVDNTQAKLIVEAQGTVEIRDRRGNHLGFVAHGFSAEDIALAKQRLAADGPRFTTREVLDHLRSLEQVGAVLGPGDSGQSTNNEKRTTKNEQ